MKHHYNLVSCSGGKDSTATLLLALTQFPHTTTAVFADTGNEHETTLEYLDYLERELGIKIVRLKSDFTQRFDHKRKWILEKWPAKGVSLERCERAAALLQPSGNPYLDMCMLRGRFPSRMAQFCTEELKTKPLTEFALNLIDSLDWDVWSWQGVRRDESAKRSEAQGHEDLTGRIWAHRPIAGWTAQQTVDFVVKTFGVKLNPLYEQGMGRVGCMPCINVSKAELSEIARRFPEHVERISEWERIVADVSKRGAASFFPSPDDGRGELRGRDVVSYVRWAQTFRGGKVHDPQWDAPAASCSSSYGLCE